MIYSICKHGKANQSIDIGKNKLKKNDLTTRY